jgi:hypothetical protein
MQTITITCYFSENHTLKKPEREAANYWICSITGKSTHITQQKHRKLHKLPGYGDNRKVGAIRKYVFSSHEVSSV